MGGPGAPGYDVRRAVARDEVGEDGERAGVHVGREVDARRGGHHRAPPDVGPAPVVPREHLVVVAGVAGCDHTGLDDGHPRCPVDVDAGGTGRGLEPCEPSSRVRAGVVADVDGGRADVVRHPQDALDPVAASGDESPTERPQRGVEIGERLEQEPGAVRSVERAGEDGVVEHEQRDDDVVAPHRLRQRRVVGHAQVAREHDDRARRHRPTLRPWQFSRAGPRSGRRCPTARPTGRVPGGERRVRRARGAVRRRAWATTPPRGRRARWCRRRPSATRPCR